MMKYSMVKFSLLFLGLVMVSLSSYGWSLSDLFGSSSKTTEVLGIKISAKVPSEQTLKMKEDLVYLKGMNLSVSPVLQKELSNVLNLDLFGSSQAGSDVALQWLLDRVGYVVGEDYDLQDNFVVVRSSYTYDNRYDEPKVEKPKSSPSSKPKSKTKSSVKTVMANIGTAVYFAGKQSGSLLGLKFDGKTVAMKSPRTGLIQVGEGLFSRTKATKHLPDDSLALRMSRLVTFFHEARHSDGNGKSLGFFHSVCPDGHDYSGYSACDRNSNGPYTVGHLVNRMLKESCTECKVEDKTALEALAADALSRVLKEKKSVPVSVDIKGSLVELYQGMVDLFCPEGDKYVGIKDESTCNKYREKLAGAKGINEIEVEDEKMAAKPWDDTPEGRLPDRKLPN